MLEIETLKNLAALISTVLSVAAVIYVFFTSASKRNTTTLADHETRVAAIENELKHLPDKDDVTDLKLEITRLTGTVGRLDEATKGISRVVTRIDSYMMKRPE